MSIVTEINLLKKRRTKIIATIGPATSEPEKIKQLLEAGVNIFRLNMSHGDHAFHHETYNNIRGIGEEFNQPIGILADLCGPKIRTGQFENGGIELEKGSSVIVTTRGVEGKPGLIPSQYKALADDVESGDRILLNDGNLELKVEATKGTEISCTVIHGGTLKDYKGINLPGINVSAPSLTEKDRHDARFALELGVDFLALSFVRSAADIQQLKDFISSSNTNTDVSIIAKIEKPEALEDVSAILDLADGIMVARGDLGVELSPEQVPVAQHQLIDRARRQFKPVIVATQMLESMIENARPTRAEVADVANAVTLGTDAVMLSGETAVGEFPIDAVRMMDRIARQTESYLWHQHAYGTILNSADAGESSIWDAVANAMAQLAHDLNVHAVVVISQSGMSAATLSSARPAAPVVAITKIPSVCRKMALLWSVIPVQSDDAGLVNPNTLARTIVLEHELADKGDLILLVRGFHSDTKLNTPSVTVISV